MSDQLDFFDSVLYQIAVSLDCPVSEIFKHNDKKDIPCQKN